GIHPFMGVWQGSGNPPTLQENIGTGASPYTQPERIARSPVAPPFEMLSPELRALFLRCFGEGLTRPERRPSAQDWADALEEVERRLTHCGYNRQHVYGNHLQLCPWCDRIRDGFPDPFPSASRGASIAAPVLPRPVANVRTVTVATQPLPSATAAAVPATQVRAPQRLARSAAAAVPARQAETRSRRRGAFVLVGAVAALIAVAWALPHFSDGTLASPRPVAATPTVTSFWVSNHRLAEMWSQALRTATEQNFGMTSQQFCVFEVRRQEGNRFFVFNPYTNNYFWIDADAVGKIGVPEHHPGPKPDQQNCAPEVYDD
ncbi:MAG: hypothetical protein NTZ05_05285, partial [Chloroflexi bacterium]|nr:hypothetical protein [Chloroflexota bacterium]